MLVLETKPTASARAFSRQPTPLFSGAVVPETRLLRKGLGLLAAQQLAVSGDGRRAWTELCRHRLLTPRLRSGWAPFLFIQNHKLLLQLPAPGPMAVLVSRLHGGQLRQC